MFKLGLRILALLGLVVVGSLALAALSFERDWGKYSFLSAIVDKNHRLHSTPSPRIIFVGGSNLAFGVDSPLVEREMEMPVVNMGLHAALGLRYMLTHVQSGLGAGDLVVVIPEYEQFYDYVDGKETLLDMLLVFPEGVQYLSSPYQIGAIVAGMPISLQNMVRAKLDRVVFGPRPLEDAIYYRGGFNVEGDVVSHLNEPSKDISSLGFGISGSTSDESIRIMSEFNRLAELKGARVFYTFPAIPKSGYLKVQTKLSTLCHTFQMQNDLTFLGAPQDYILSDNSFYDTVYHLNRQGRQVRTTKLIADLRRALVSQAEIHCDGSAN